ncbi:ECF transporter S component (plasmid) [Cytobacillus spongiae]|uniref:ECF transporter S component n=1 Tax=Cytobacillus spongiae TaxID=2901381 RepID=UPI00145FA61E|nr:ECF transporter S component [Cytobacillus spongiae]MCA1062885.1 ECF transporter S component [Rossellomorea aquimaris]NMH70218.1 ECF transporter S component [Bacillus sp. RO3]UII58491.1 ECF transporter S component [Cytobacillus spongiae]WJV28486.1 ECF transporter S component [Rossellomorea sp. AcN35-11]
MKSNLKILLLLSLFMAFSAIGGMVKFPAVIGTVALDSMPALLIASLYNGRWGAIVAVGGHLLSSLYAGFPLGPFHLLIGIEIGIFVWLFGIVFSTGRRILAATLFLIGNGVVAGIPFVFILSPSFYYTIVPSLLVASFINLTLAHFLYPPLVKRVPTEASI